MFIRLRLMKPFLYWVEVVEQGSKNLNSPYLALKG